MLTKITDDEITYVQNSALGAVSLWRFICGYISVNNIPVPFPIIFIILPIVFDEELRNFIKNTHKQSGLIKLASKISSQKNSDKIYKIHLSSEIYKNLTLQSFQIALNTKLISIDPKTAYILPITKTPKSLPLGDSKIILEVSEKLGFWCGSITLHEISSLLKVRF